MSQYQIGTVITTNGSTVVTGLGTEWESNVSVGDSFKKLKENVVYEIASVDSDTQITLSSNYGGSTESGSSYNILRDFTDNFNLREIWAGDKDWPYHLTLTLREIDRLMKWLEDRVQSSATTTTTTTTTTSSSSTTTTTGTTTSSSTTTTTSP